MPRRGRGEGSVEHLASGRYRAVISAGYGPNLKRIKLSKTFRTKRAALVWLRARLDERETGDLAQAGRRTVADWLTEWLEFKRSRIQPRSLLYYRLEVEKRLVPVLGHVRLSELTPIMIERAHTQWTRDGFSANTQRNAASTLRTALADAIQLRVLNSNPARAVAKPRHKRKEIQALTRTQARAFLDACKGHRLEPLYVLALDTGARPGELLALHWSDIDMVKGTVTISKALEEIDGVKFRIKEPKTAAGRRRIKLSPMSIEALSRLPHPESDCPLFTTRSGGWLSQPGLYAKVFKPMCRKAGLPDTIRPYALRHTSATLLLQAGVNIKTVSVRLGHENVETTLRHYAHALPEHQDAVADAVQELFGLSPHRPTAEQLSNP